MKTEAHDDEQQAMELVDWDSDDRELIGTDREIDDEYEEWPEDPEEVMQQREHQQWVEYMRDIYLVTKTTRLVELGHFRVALFEDGRVSLIRHYDDTEQLPFRIDPSGYTDAELREKLRTYLIFS